MADAPILPLDSGARTRGAAETTVAGAPVAGYRWAIIGLLSGQNWAMTVTGISLGLLLPDITDSLGLTNLQGGWLSAAMRIGSVVTGFPAAVFLSRYSPLKLSIVSTFLGALFTFGHGIAPGFAAFFIARLGFGMSFAARFPARTLLLQHWFPLKEVVLANGVVIGMTGVAEGLTLILTPLLLDATGSWRLTYHLFGACAFLVFVLWLVAGRERTTPAFQARVRAEGKPPLRSLFRYRELWLVGLGSLGAEAGWWTYATFWPTYMLEEHSFSLARSGFLFALISTGMVPASIGVGFLAKVVRSRFLLLAGCGVLMAGSLVGMTLTTHMGLLAVFALLAGASWAFIPIAFSIPFEIPGIQPREVAVGSTMIVTLLLVGGVIGPIMGGALSDTTGSLHVALVVCGLMPLTLVLFPAFVRRQAS